MKYSILFSIFSVVVGISFCGTAIANPPAQGQAANGSGCGNAAVCVVNGSGNGNGSGSGQQGQNQQQFQANNCHLVNDSCYVDDQPATPNQCKSSKTANGGTVCYDARITCAGSWIDNGNGVGRCDESNSEKSVENADPTAIRSQAGIDCRDSTSKATNACDPKQNSDMGAVMQLASTISNGIGMTVGSDMTAACSKMGEFAEKSAAATAAYKGYCSFQYSECQKSCNAALSDAQSLTNGEKPAIQQLLKKCNGMTQNMADAGNAMMQLVGAKINMANCKNLTTDCILNPTAASCVASTDCTNATVATTNLVCICQSNPSDSRCGGGLNPNLNGGFGGSPALAGSSGTTTDGSLGGLGLGDGGFGSITPPGAGTGTNGQAQSLAAGMQGGHNLGNTGGVNNAYQAPGAGGAGNGNKASILSGYYGGSGSGGFGSGGSGSGSNGGYGGYGAGGVGTGKGGLDLKQFLPGGAKDPSRGIAGISGPDGITGPNSDIWQKVNTRYNAKSQVGSFLP